MASNVKSHKREFIDTDSDLVDNVQVKMLAYIQDLLGQGKSNSIPAEGPESTLQAGFKKGQGELDIEDGFPVMPVINIEAKGKKEDWEDLMRQYLTRHYSEWYKMMPRHRLSGT